MQNKVAQRHGLFEVSTKTGSLRRPVSWLPAAGKLWNAGAQMVTLIVRMK